MKFRNRHAYSPVDELNRENERELLGPFVAPLIFGLAFILGLALCLKYADQIDRFATDHWELLGWTLFAASLFGIIRLVKRMTW